MADRVARYRKKKAGGRAKALAALTVRSTERGGARKKSFAASAIPNMMQDLAINKATRAPSAALKHVQSFIAKHHGDHMDNDTMQRTKAHKHDYVHERAPAHRPDLKHVRSRVDDHLHRAPALLGAPPPPPPPPAEDAPSPPRERHTRRAQQAQRSPSPGSPRRNKARRGHRGGRRKMSTSPVGNNPDGGGGRPFPYDYNTAAARLARDL